MKIAIKNKILLSQLGCFMAAILVYVSILLIGIPRQVNHLIFAKDSTILTIIISIILYLAYRPVGWLNNLTSITATLGLFAIQLSAIWQTGLGKSAFILGGLITLTDTDAYYTSALNLVEGRTFTVIGSWRPLAQGFFAVILAFTRQNLQVSLAILVLVTALSCYLLAKEIQRHYGTSAAVLILVTTFLFYRIYLGAVSTESLGLTLGCLSLAALLSAALENRVNLFIVSLFFLTVAMMARAGAIFILPCLIIWGTWNFRGARRLNLKILLGSIAAVLLGVFLNSIIFKLVANPEAAPSSNFFYSLYGLLVGGDWLTVFSQYPEIKKLPDKEQAHQVSLLVWQYLKTHPLSLFKGMLRAWQQFIFDDFVFSFVESIKINVFLQVLTVIGLIQSIRKRKSVMGSLSLMLLLGILLSVPFVPPWDARTRPYAATIPFFALYPALGLFYTAKRLEWRQIFTAPRMPNYSQLTVIFGLGLISLIVFGTITLKLTSQAPQIVEKICPVGLQSVSFRKVEGSSINILADEELKNSYTPNFRLSDFRNMLQEYKNRYSHHAQIPELIDELTEKVTANTSILRRINLKTGQTIWLVTKTSKIPPSEGVVSLCGKPSSNPALQHPTSQYLEFLFYLD